MSLLRISLLSSVLIMAPPIAIDIQSVTDTQVATITGPFSINGVSARRAKAPQIDGGLVAHASSEMFKGPVCCCFSALLQSYLVLRLLRGTVNLNPKDGTVSDSHV